MEHLDFKENDDDFKDGTKRQLCGTMRKRKDGSVRLEYPKSSRRAINHVFYCPDECGLMMPADDEWMW